jgi:hypothetical protein
MDPILSQMNPVNNGMNGELRERDLNHLPSGYKAEVAFAAPVR